VLSIKVPSTNSLEDTDKTTNPRLKLHSLIAPYIPIPLARRLHCAPIFISGFLLISSYAFYQGQASFFLPNKKEGGEIEKLGRVKIFAFNKKSGRFGPLFNE